jgi:hypothetical protein
MATKLTSRLAEILGLSTVGKGGPFGPSAVGAIEGFPVGAAWANVNRVSVVALLIRYRKGSLTVTVDALKQEIAASPEVLKAIGRKKLTGAEIKMMSAGEGALTFFWQYSLRAPKPEAAAELVRVILKLIAARAKPVGGTCEACERSSGELFCVDGVPNILCAACRERAGEEDRRLAEAYEAQTSNPGLGTLGGVVACVVMALAWGLVAYSLNRIFLYGGILIGLAIAWAVNKGMGKINTYGRVLTVALTLTSVLLGDFFFVTLISSDQLNTPLNLDLASAVADHFLEIEFAGADGYLSLLFGLIGAVYILYKNRPPVGRREMVPVGANAAGS